VIEVTVSEDEVYLLCVECEATLDVDPLRCPIHGEVDHMDLRRVFTPGAVETWLLPETYERLTGKKSRRRRDEPRPARGGNRRMTSASSG
jgi:hypothetical protein